MKRILGTINRRGSQDSTETEDANGDSPEANVARGVRLFCESGGPNNSGEEVLHLPVIVEAAESSPAAAREAANRIRKFLSKDNFQRAYVQYNAIMLVRILADNPGRSFTKNLDVKFVITVKELLRDGRDMSVQQILRETLDSFETQKADNETLAPLREMWKKEKAKIEKGGTPLQPLQQQPPGPPIFNAPAFDPNQQNYFARNHKPRGLPPPHELAQRVEEAKTSSKLLLQVVQSTSPAELQGNDLIREFVERCQSASRSIQNYIHSDSPPPDEDTLLTLIETNDQISTALSRHQRALLQARRVTGASSGSTPPAGPGGPFEALGSLPSGAPPVPTSFSPPPGPPPRRQQSQPYQQDPFDDRHETNPQQQETMHVSSEPQSYGLPPPGPPLRNGTNTLHKGMFNSGSQPPSRSANRQARPVEHDPISPLDEPYLPEEPRSPFHRF
ncbi:hypothetical protein MMC22_005861 [Lobaria immixta]|nr:hypothetical protein [Lobaria immixta]